MTGTVTATQIPILQLVNGQPVYDGGALSPTAEYYFGGEPVVDPFTGQQLYYTGGQPVLNLLTGRPEYGPDGQELLHKAGDPILHVAGDPVIHADGDPVVYLGGELVIQQNGSYVSDGDFMSGSPALSFAAASGGNDATITRSSGNWLADGFAPGTQMLVSNMPNGTDDGVYLIAAVDSTGTVLSWCRNRAASLRFRTRTAPAWRACSPTPAARPRFTTPAIRSSTS